MEKIKIKLNRLEAEWLISRLMSAGTKGYAFQPMPSVNKCHTLLIEIAAEAILTRYIDKAINSDSKNITFALSISEAHAISFLLSIVINSDILGHEIAWASSITVKIDAELSRIITARHRIAQARKERF